MGMAMQQPNPASNTNLLALPEGTELVGDYRIQRVLGAGGFGITYLANEPALARLVTIKEYFPADYAARGATSQAAPRSQGCAEDYKWGLERFIEEARTLAKFIHPNIVRVHRLLPRQQHRLHGARVRGRRQLQVLAEGPQASAAPARARPHSGAAARCARAGAQGRLPAPRHRPRQHHHPQRRLARADRLRLGARRDRLPLQDRERPGQAGLQPLRAVRHHQQQAGAVDRHLCARRHALSRAVGQAAARCALAHGQRRIRAGSRCRAQLLPSRISSGHRQGARARGRRAAAVDRRMARHAAGTRAQARAPREPCPRAAAPAHRGLQAEDQERAGPGAAAECRAAKRHAQPGADTPRRSAAQGPAARFHRGLEEAPAGIRGKGRKESAAGGRSAGHAASSSQRRSCETAYECPVRTWIRAASRGDLQFGACRREPGRRRHAAECRATAAGGIGAARAAAAAAGAELARAVAAMAVPALQADDRTGHRRPGRGLPGPPAAGGGSRRQRGVEPDRGLGPGLPHPRPSRHGDGHCRRRPGALDRLGRRRRDAQGLERGVGDARAHHRARRRRRHGRSPSTSSAP